MEAGTEISEYSIYAVASTGTVKAGLSSLTWSVASYVEVCQGAIKWGETKNTNKMSGKEMPFTHHAHVMQHSAVHLSFIKLGLILGEANVIQPP